MNYQIEVSRNNVTLSSFFSAVKAACKKKGIDFCLDREEFENPTRNESSSYYVKDGLLYYTYNGYTVERHADDAAAQSEVCRTKPLDYQAYILNFDGSVFNEICEFTFSDDKRGCGYYFQLNKD